MTSFSIKKTSYTLVSTLLLVSATLSTAVCAKENTLLEYSFTSEKTFNKNEFSLIPFAGDTQISSIVANDLNYTKLKSSPKQNPEIVYSSEQVQKNLSQWQQLAVPYLIVGKTSLSNGSIFIEYEVLDLETGKVMQGKQSMMVSANKKNEIAHKIADDIYKIITGTPGDSSGRIAYVEETKNNGTIISSLKIMDSDTLNKRTIFRKAGSIFTPVWSPDGQNIAFSHQSPNAKAVIYIQNINSKAPVLVTPFKAQNMSPSFDPYGNNIIYSSSSDGNSDIYRLNLNSNNPRKLISMPSIEGSPSYAPDGRSFVFTSDKAGNNTPQIYRYTFSTKRVDKITSSGRQDLPTYSPDGSKIAFLNGTDAAIMNANGSGIRTLAKTKDQAPRFSSNGTRVVYTTRRNGEDIIRIQSLDGGATLTSPSNGRLHSAVWSNAAQ